MQAGRQLLLEPRTVPRANLFRARGIPFPRAGRSRRREQAAEAGASDTAITWYPEGRGVRLHPRFAEFAAKTGLLEYWQQFGMPDDLTRRPYNRVHGRHRSVVAGTRPR